MTAPMTPPLLELDGLGRRYGALNALAGVTVTVPAGRVGLLGPNGAGKSSLLKILMGLLPPSAGSGRVLGHAVAVNGRANPALRRLIGFMPETDSLVPGLTGLEYVALAGELYGMPRRQAERRAHEVLGYLGLDEARYRRVEDYSAGMKQRAKLAQALVHDPPVLLLDEPTSGLDPAGRDAMLGLVRDLGVDHGKSILLSTHLLADVQAVCERVVILAGGQVRGAGEVADLLARRADRFRLRVQGDAAPFRADLAAGGVSVLADDGRGQLRVSVPARWSNWMFFKLAEANDVTIRSLTRDDETLEELFLRSVGPVPSRIADRGSRN